MISQLKPRCFRLLVSSTLYSSRNSGSLRYVNSVTSAAVRSTPPKVDSSKRKLKQRVTLAAPNLCDGEGICAAYCLHNSISLTKAANYVKSSIFVVEKRGTVVQYNSKQMQIFLDDVVHIGFRGTDENRELHEGHAFFFSSGAMVFWGLPAKMRKQLFESLSTYQDGTHSNGIKSALGMRDFEHEFRYTMNDSRTQTTFRNDEIKLARHNDVSHMLALSYGLAQSARLLVYEEVVDSLVARTRTLPDELAEHGHVKLSHRELKRLIGELLAARYSVNLVSDILDTPEYFWQHGDLERLHLECAREVELRKRAHILDTRTKVINDALAILNNELSSSSSDRVERAILFLIGVEVAIEVAKAFFSLSV